MNIALEQQCSLLLAAQLVCEQLRSKHNLPPRSPVLLVMALDGYQLLRTGNADEARAAEVTKALGSWMIGKCALQPCAVLALSSNCQHGDEPKLKDIWMQPLGDDAFSKPTACGHAAAPRRGFYGQCVLAGLEVSRSGTGFGAMVSTYHYLQPLTLEDSQAALTDYFVSAELYSKDQMARLFNSPLTKTQLALASGLPQLLDFLRRAMEDNVVREALQASEQLPLDGR